VYNYYIKPGFIGLQTQYLRAQVGHFFCLPVEPENMSLSSGASPKSTFGPIVFSTDLGEAPEKYAKEAICNLRNWIAAYKFPQLKTRIVV
jgi:hypothetical protein